MSPFISKSLQTMLCLSLAACGSGGGSGDDCLICGTPPNKAPTASEVTLDLAPGESYSGVVRTRDPEGDPISFFIDSLPTRGDLRLTSNSQGAFIYNAPGAFTSEEIFVIGIRDDQGNRSPAVFNVRISGALASKTCAINTAELGARPSHIAIHPRDPSRIAVLTRDGGNYVGIHTSSDGGTSWLHSDALRELDVVDLAFHPTLHGVLFSAVSGFDQAGVKISDNHGATWRTRLEVEGARDINLPWLSQSVGTNIWVASESGLHLSEDDGRTWAGVETSRGFFSVANDRAHPLTAYASTASGLFRTRDDSIWDRDGEGAKSKLTFALEGVYAANDHALTRTTIGVSSFGATTHLLGSGAGIPVVLSDFFLHPDKTELLYVIESERLMISKDAGVGWSHVDAADSLGPLSAVSVSGEVTVFVGTLDGIACLRL